MDDELELLQGTLQRVLRGHDCVFVADGFGALDLIAREYFDVLVTDLRMAPLGGFELCVRAREVGFMGALIVLSAFVDPEARQSARLCGAHDVVSKADGYDELRRAVDNLVALKGAPSATSAPASARNVETGPGVHKTTGIVELRRMGLTVAEGTLFAVLEEAVPGAVPLPDICSAVWPGERVESNKFHQRLGGLRRKIGPRGFSIRYHDGAYALTKP